MSFHSHATTAPPSTSLSPADSINEAPGPDTKLAPPSPPAPAIVATPSPLAIKIGNVRLGEQPQFRGTNPLTNPRNQLKPLPPLPPPPPSYQQHLVAAAQPRPAVVYILPIAAPQPAPALWTPLPTGVMHHGGTLLPPSLATTFVA